MASVRGIPLSKVSPAFLHANSTSHTWAFSAFAELIDNAYDPDVSASELLIDKVDIRGIPCLIFLDNGAGMDRDHLLKMLSFGFCEKEIYERQGSHQPIGHYGNGFKSGSMRLGKDALVFTRCQHSASIGFLSQTYLKATKADSVFVPILDYRLPHLERIKSQESRNNLNAILQYSVFKDERELKEELRALEGSKTGTKIIISNLKRLQDLTYELDFSSDHKDIRCPEAHEADMTSVYHRPIQHNSSEYKRSLREYCSILFLRPRMKITIRGVRVKSKLIAKSLSNTEIDMYKPTWLSRPVKIIFGFTCETEKEDYGMMLYHRNRLIKAFEKVGYQKQPNDLGLGVVGVAQVDFLQPIHNKQDFNKDEKFNSVMSAFAIKLNDYWNEKKNPQGPSAIQPVLRNLPDWLWAQCDQCLKWRRLPDGIDHESLPEQWYCRMNPDATHNRCDIPEEPEDEDLAVKPTYEKTFKKKQEERKRQQQMEREKEEEIKRRKIMEKERELKEKEARLRAIEHVAASQPLQENRAVTSLQKALAEAKRREEQQKRMILQIQEQKKQMEEQRNTLLQMAEGLQNTKGKKTKEMLDQMSQVLSKINSPATPVGTSKRKSGDESPPTPKGGKKMCIKTETGEVLSITQNLDVDDDDDDHDDETARIAPSSPAKKPKQQHLKPEPLKIASSFVHPKPSQSNAPAASSSKPSPSGKQTKVTQPQSSSASSSTTTTPSISSSPSSKSGGKKRQKGTVVAVIDLTSESEFGELVDVKPDLEELRTKLQENMQQEQDIKPDKDVLDAAIGQPDNSQKDKEADQEIAETKKEIEESQPENTTAVNNKVNNTAVDEREKDEKAGKNNEDDSIQFGPSADDPEFPMDIPESFQDNLEAAMAAIQERIEKEKTGQGGGSSDNVVESTKGVDGGGDKAKGIQNTDEEAETQTKAATKRIWRDDSESSLESVPEMQGSGDRNRKLEDYSDADKGDDKNEKSNLGKETSVTVKDFLPTGGGDDGEEEEGYNDFVMDDDDSDYRGDSVVSEKGDSSDSLVEKKKCASASGGSRSNSAEDGGEDSSHEHVNDGQPSVKDGSVGMSSDNEQEEKTDGKEPESVKVHSPNNNQTSSKLQEEIIAPAENRESNSAKTYSSHSNSIDETEGEELDKGEVIESVRAATPEKMTNGPLLDTVKEGSSADKSKAGFDQSGAGAASCEVINEVSCSEVNSANVSIKEKENGEEISSYGLEKNSPHDQEGEKTLLPVQGNENSSQTIERDSESHKKSKDHDEEEYDNGVGNIQKCSINSAAVKTLPESGNVEKREVFASQNKSVSKNETCSDRRDEATGVSSSVDDNIVFEGFRDESDSDSHINSVPMLEQPTTPEDPSLPLSPPPSDSSPTDIDSVSMEECRNDVNEKQLSQGGSRTGTCGGKKQQENLPQTGKEENTKKCDLGTSCEKYMQTELDMSSLQELMHRKQTDSLFNKSFSHQDIQTDVSALSETADINGDRSWLETSSPNKTFSEAEVQTNLAGQCGSDNSMEELALETVEELRAKLSLKTEQLEKMEMRLTETHVNIHKLLGFIVPDTDLGDVSNIEQMIRLMIRVNEEASQPSQSQGNDDGS